MFDVTVAKPVITIAPVTNVVTEGTDAQFRVTASRAPTSDLSVTASITAQGDFGVNTTANWLATIQANQTSATFSVSTEPDDVDEPDGSVTATLRDVTSYTLGNPSSATVTIRDDGAVDDIDDGGDGLNSPPRITRMFISNITYNRNYGVEEVRSGDKTWAGYGAYDRDDLWWDYNNDGIHDEDGGRVVAGAGIKSRWLRWSDGLKPLDPTGYGEPSTRWLVGHADGW